MLSPLVEILLWIAILCAAAPFSHSLSEPNIIRGIYPSGLLELADILKKC